jgi:hypothetical protein
VVAVLALAPASALAASEFVKCTDSSPTDVNLLAMAVIQAGNGDTITITGTCEANLTITNPAKFTIDGGGSTTWTPATTTTPMIASSTADMAFTVSGIAFSGTTNASAIALTGNAPAVTVSDDSFVNDTTSSSAGAAIEFAPPPASPLGTQPSVVEDSTFGAVGSPDTGPEGGAIFVGGPLALTLSDNTFIADHGYVGGAVAILAPGEYSIAGNTFGGTAAGDGNTASGGGGAVWIQVAPTSGESLTINDNRFLDNAVDGSPGADDNFPATGGALTVALAPGGQGLQVSQSGNTFSGNIVDATAPAGQTKTLAGGGAEWLFAVTDHSVGDVFTGNEVAVNDGAAPEGGALGVLGQAAIAPTPAQPGVFVGEDDVFTGNAVASGGWGGAIYSGFPAPYCTMNCPGSTVTLDDSTVSGNSVASGSGSQGGALWGDPDDTLNVSNSIIYGSTPAPETFGFGTLNFAYSDACSSGTTVEPGTGNICADPLLNTNGSETATSPTIDKGSNALVPSGLSTDAAGSPRITEGLATTCSAVVDMGAFESAAVAPAPSCTAGPGAGTPSASGGTATSSGVTLTISCAGVAGATSCTGTATLQTIEHIVGHKIASVSRARRRSRTVTVGQRSFTVIAGGSLNVSIPLNSTGRSLLKRFGKLPVELIATTAGKLTLTKRQLTIKLPRHHHH